MKKILKKLALNLLELLPFPPANSAGLSQFIGQFSKQHPKVLLQYDEKMKTAIIGSIPNQVIVGPVQPENKIASSFHAACAPAFAALIGGSLVSFFGEILILGGYVYRENGTICAESAVDYSEELSRLATEKINEVTVQKKTKSTKFSVN